MISADTLNRKGAELYLQGDLAGAELHYLASLQQDSRFLPALANMGVIESAKNNLVGARAYVEKYLMIEANDGSQLNNLSNILTRMELFEDAETVAFLATNISPDNPATWHNLALLLAKSHRPKEALQALDRSEALGHKSHQVTNDRAHFMLDIGDDLPTALEVYEARWHNLRHHPAWDYHIPEWQGEHLLGKRILFHMEQGYGDTIMCARFVKNLVSLGAHVTLAVSTGLVRLFELQAWRNVDVVELETMGDDFPAGDYDFQSPMYSGMKHLKIQQNDISGHAYLEAPELELTLPTSGFNVGICWNSGKRGDENDYRRRISDLGDWLQFTKLPNVNLWSLQKLDGDDISRLGVGGLIQDTTNEWADFADTAAFIDALDLVICVDTAVAHLAGALGKPIWMLSQFTNCWRWWDINNRSGLPWYKSMQILRQPTPGDWKFGLDLSYRMLLERNSLLDHPTFDSFSLEAA